MNKSNTLFKNLIDQSIKDYAKKTSKSFANYLADRLDITERKLFADNSYNMDEIRLKHPNLAVKLDKLIDQHSKLLCREEGQIAEIKYLQMAYENDQSFDKFDILSKYLKLYQLKRSQKADVLAYFLNKNISGLLKKGKDENNIRNYAKILEKQAMEENPDNPIWVMTVAHEATNEFVEAYKHCESLRNLINEDGELLPCENAKDYFWIFASLTFLIKTEDVLLILEESERRAGELTESKKKITQEIPIPKVVKFEGVSYEEQRKSCKEQKLVAQELKQYINDGIPTRYLTSEDLIKMNKLFATLNYTDEQIARIQKSIVINNARIEEENLIIKFDLAKKEFLSEEEQTTINDAKSIITDENSKKNTYYYSICEICQALKHKLITAFDLKHQQDQNIDEYELAIIDIMCSIEELSNALQTYSYSNFSFVPKRKKSEEE